MSAPPLSNDRTSAARPATSDDHDGHDEDRNSDEQEEQHSLDDHTD
jgi:hypothetical protein